MDTPAWLRSSALLAAACFSGIAGAAEVRLHAVGSVTPILRVLAPEFERASGVTLSYTTDTSGATLKRLRSEPADVGIVSTPMLKELEAAGLVVPEATTIFAKSSAGVAVRKGTRIDVASYDGLRQAIVAAGAVAVVDPKRGSTLGTHMQTVADRLGVGAALRPKLKLYSGGLTVGEAVARGEADFGIGFIPELLAIPGVEVAGPLPGDADYSSLATAVIMKGAENRAAGSAFIAFMLSPLAQKVIRERGMEPIAPPR